MTILVKIAYDGTNYHGFQIQDDVITVFGVFQEALLKILGHKTDIKGCSRTDSGVHAACYYLSFETEKQLNIPRLPLALNANLPLDIRVLEAKQVADGFHARYDCKGKQYTYNIRNSHTGIQRRIGILEHHSRGLPEFQNILFGLDLLSVKDDLATGGLVKMQQSSAYGSLATAGLANQA